MALIALAIISGLLATLIAITAVLYLRVPVRDVRTGLIYHPHFSGPDTKLSISLSDSSLLKPESMPGYVTAALLLHEDDLFFFHRGVNLREVRARLSTYFFGGGPLAGGSSITQQLAKSILCREPAAARWRRSFQKMYELLCAIKLERELSKREILILYLNTARFGALRLQGFQLASRQLFKKEASALSLPETMFLVGLLPRAWMHLGIIVNRKDVDQFPYRTTFVKFVDLYRLYVNTWGWRILDHLGEISYRDIVERMVDFNQYQPTALCEEFELSLEVRAMSDTAETRQVVVELAHRDDPNLAELFKRIPKAEEALLRLVRSLHGFASHPLKQVNWEKLFDLARRHRVCEAFMFGAKDTAPPEILNIAAAEQAKLVEIHLYFRAVLSLATRILDGVGVPFLLYKGLAIQAQYYAGRFRPSADIDLIVHEADLSNAVEALSKEGFFPLKAVGKLSLSSGCTLTRGDGFEIDLHTCIIDGYLSQSPLVEDLFARKSFLPALGCFTLCSSDHLLAILLHGWKHQWCRLLWILDVALLIRTVPKSIVEARCCLGRETYGSSVLPWLA